MRKCLVGLSLLVLFAAAPARAQVEWFSAGIKTSPAVGTIMADTGPAALGAYSVICQCTGTAVGVYLFQQFNADGTPQVGQLLAHPALGHDGLQSIPLIALADGERLKIITVTPMTGVYSCSIWATFHPIP